MSEKGDKLSIMYCPKCGMQCHSDYAFCAKCGFSIAFLNNDEVMHNEESIDSYSENLEDTEAESRDVLEESCEVPYDNGNASEEVFERPIKNYTQIKNNQSPIINKIIIAGIAIIIVLLVVLIVGTKEKKNNQNDFLQVAHENDNTEIDKTKIKGSNENKSIIPQIEKDKIVIEFFGKKHAASENNVTLRYGDGQPVNFDNILFDSNPHMGISQDGQAAWFEATDHNLYCIQKDFIPIQIPDISKNTKIIDFAKDDKYLYYAVVTELPAKVIASGPDYVTIEDSGNNTETALKLFDLKSKESILIQNNVGEYCLSPDKETIVYINYDGGICELCMYSIGDANPTVILSGSNLSDMRPVAISNKAKNIIVYDASNSELSYVSKGQLNLIKKIDERNNWSGRVYVNEDRTEIAIAEEGSENSYYYKIGDDSLVTIYDQILAENIKDCEYDTFVGKIYLCYRRGMIMKEDTKLVCFKKNSTELIDRDIRLTFGWPHISEDGNSVVYVNDNDGKAYYVENAKKSIMPVQIGGSLDNIVNIVTSSDNKKIYLVTDNNELYYVKNVGEVERISADIGDTHKIEFSDRTGMIYFIQNGDCYGAKDSADSKVRVGSDVKNVYSSWGRVYAETSDDNIIVDKDIE